MSTPDGRAHAYASRMATTPVFVPSSNPDLFLSRIDEARSLWDIARGTCDEDACWTYYEAVVRLARIARGSKLTELGEVMRAV